MALSTIRSANWRESTALLDFDIVIYSEGRLRDYKLVRRTVRGQNIPTNTVNYKTRGKDLLRELIYYRVPWGFHAGKGTVGSTVLVSTDQISFIISLLIDDDYSISI